ncbi:hypothetical protein QR98_0014420 [Sarcoptes scabiei]|uniref:Uncharacterized protein n=1 Tax=Sarcoptes scabiei TaxID=52283 RepID=A0A131ZWE4_SARSC|nr:hypothetical protein QR98_0014420 [Sarcoptes scabiei]
MNYSFDFAFNQIINDYSRTKIFQHYIYSQREFLKVSFDSNDYLQLNPFKFQLTLADRNNQPKKFDQTYLDEFYQGDFGFSLQGTKPYTNKICSAKIHRNHLTCLDVLYKSSSKSIIVGKQIYLFEFDKDFRPSIAFQHIGYDHYASSRNMVILIEQKLRIQSDFDVNNQTVFHRLFTRRWQIYSFDNLNRITNLTYSAIIPDYLETIPPQLELTGVFGWTRRKTNEDEFLILTFNGSNHLYCLNENCANIENYRVYLTECNAPSELIRMNQNDFESFNRGLIVTKCCGQWRQFDEDYDNNNNNAFDVNDARWKLKDGKLYLIKSARSSNLNYRFDRIIG